MSKVSVIIPAYNAERYIEKCLLSLTNQTFEDFEIIVVDDGSNDKTCEIASRYARVIKSTENLGEGAAKNLGAKESKGEILAFTDADVVLPVDWIEKIIKSIKIYDIKCVGGGYCGSIGNSFMERFAYLELSHRRRNVAGFVNTLVSNNFACDRSVFLEFGGFPRKYKAEDLRLSYLISKKYKIYWDKDNGVYHHFRNDLKGYLKQQYYFARDTVWTYYYMPELFFSKTHQGHSIYIECGLLFFCLLLLPVWPEAIILAIIAVAIVNLPFLHFISKQKLNVGRSFGLIVLRDVTAVIGILSGIRLLIGQIFKRRHWE